MPFYRDIPIKWKLMTIIVFAATAVLMIAGMAFFAYELITFRQAMTERISVTAQIIGANNVGALSFNDAQFAEKTLATLNLEADIMAAALYKADGTLFVKYEREKYKVIFPLRSEKDKTSFENGQLVVFRQIVFDNETIGFYLYSCQPEQFVQSFVALRQHCIAGCFCIHYSCSCFIIQAAKNYFSSYP